MDAMPDDATGEGTPDRTRWYGWYVTILLVAALAASATVYSRLPARVPLRWNMAGDVTTYGSPLGLALLMPCVMAGVLLLATALPATDPFRANYRKFMPTYRLVFACVLTLLLAVHLVTLALALGQPVPTDRVAPMGVGVLFVLVGNLLPRARRNWIFGIRTPWTLSSDRVWERTHRVGGYVLTAAGLVILASLLIVRGTNAALLIPAIAIAAGAVCVIYSYAAWRQESGQ